VTALPKHGPSQVFLAVVEDGLVSKVEKGENAGRTLQHAAVVRKLTQIGSIGPNEISFHGEARIAKDAAWKDPRVIVFVQERDSARVLAAGAP